MRILYVSRETPIHPSGGIATYLESMATAMQISGHEVFLFTWQGDNNYIEPTDYGPFKPENVHIRLIDQIEIWNSFPVGSSHNLTVSSFLAEEIILKIREWRIDVVESTDYEGPSFVLYQKLQSRSDANRQLLSTFNHGLSELIFEADQIGYPDWARVNNLCERQQFGLSDIVIVPSKAMRERIATLGITKNIKVVREPYQFTMLDNAFARVRNEIQYIGRLSIQKGIDKIIYLANILDSIFPLRKIEFIGRIGFTPFRQESILDYIRSRLNSRLASRVSFTDYRPREGVLELFEPGAIGPQLGTDETFSYACIESIDAGLVPIVRGGTAMAEFFPPELQHHVLDKEMRSVRDLQKQLGNIVENGAEISRDVRSYCQKTLDPATVAEQMGQIYQEALDKKRNWRVHAVGRHKATLSDVTVLVPAYKPNHEFMETIDSLAWQTVGLPKLLICDDGSPESHQVWFDYARALLPECRIVRQPNAGLLAARNTLIEDCDTDLAIFLDADDILAPNLIEQMLEAWNESPMQPDAVIPQRRNFGESCELVLRHLLDDYMHLLENDYRMTCLIRVEVLRDIGFDATRRNGEGDDWAFWLEFTGRGNVGVMLPEQGFLYRFRTGSMSWPWSEGQKVGTHTMLNEVTQNACRSNPQRVLALSRALFTRQVSR